MARHGRWLALGAALTLASPSLGASPSVWEQAAQASLQCVPFAREVSGVAIHGDAWTWWAQADGRYQRGRVPRVGAVMAFTPHGGMTLGHVAVVRRLVSAREVRLDHSNWSPIGGRRGQIERDVRAVDVSDAGDWSRVRVWFGPIAALGGTAWPVAGFIYPDGGDARARIASGERAERRARDRLATRDGGPVRQVAATATAVTTGPVTLAAPATQGAADARRARAMDRLRAWRMGTARGERLAAVTRSIGATPVSPAIGTRSDAGATSGRDHKRAPSTGAPAGSRLPVAIAATRPAPQPTRARPHDAAPDAPADLLALLVPARR